MSRYYNTGRHNRKSLKEKIGFYTAFSICLIAVCMAVYSTYNTVSRKSTINTAGTTPTESQLVNQPVTGVTVPEPTLEIPEPEEIAEAEVTEPTLPTVVADTEAPTQASTNAGVMDEAMQTLLAVDLSLTSPTKSGKVAREYSKDSVYFRTINVWKPHTGVDFEADLGDDVLAMVNGEVTKVYDDKMYGKTVEISSGNAVCIYSGLADIKVNKGDGVARGDKIAICSVVPCEADEKNHIHVTMKIDGKYADPLNFMGNDE